MIRYLEKGHIGWMILDNLKHRNAITLGMWKQIPEIISSLNPNKVRCLVLRGAGEQSFASGASIKEFKQIRSTLEETQKYDRILRKAFNSVEQFPSPTISMIHGYCIGGGASLSLCTDLRYASEDSKFGIPPAKLGLGYHYDKIEKLMKMLKPQDLKEILFTGNIFNTEKALNIGILNDVFPKDQLEERVSKIAKRISLNAPLTIRSIKYSINEFCKESFQRNYKLMEQKIKQCVESNDTKEGVTAFLEKRKPKFNGN